MAKVKVYELAKELNCDSKTIIQQLDKIGCVVKTHMSVVEENFAAKIREKFAAGEIKKSTGGKSKSVEEKKPTNDGFVPRVVRIPKAAAMEEAAAAAEQEHKDVINPAESGETAASPEEKKETETVQKLAVAEQPKIEKSVVSPKEEEKQPLPKEKTNQTPSMQKEQKENRFQTSRPGEKTEQGGKGPAPVGDRKFQGQNDNRGKTFNNNSRPFHKDFTGKDKDADDNKSFHNNRAGGNRGAKPGSNAPGVMPGTKYTPTPVEKQASRKGDKKQYKDKEMGNNRRNNYGGDKEIRWKSNKKQKQVKQQMPPVIPKKIIIGETIIVQELAKSMGKTAAELIKKLFGLGVNGKPGNRL